MSKKSSPVKRMTVEGDSIRKLAKPDASKSKLSVDINPADKPTKGRHQSTFVRLEDLPSKNLPKKGTFSQKPQQNVSNKSTTQAGEAFNNIPAESTSNNLRDLVGKYLDQLETQVTSTTEARTMRKSLIQIISKEENSEGKNATIRLDPNETESLEKLLIHIEGQEEKLGQSNDNTQKTTALHEIDTLKAWIGDVLTKLETGPPSVKTDTESVTSSARQSIQDLSTANPATKVDTPLVITDQKESRRSSNAAAQDKPRSSVASTGGAPEKRSSIKESSTTSPDKPRPSTKTTGSVPSSEQRASIKENKGTETDKPRPSTTMAKLRAALENPEERTPVKDKSTGVEEGKARETKSVEKTKSKSIKRKKFNESGILLSYMISHF